MIGQLKAFGYGLAVVTLITLPLFVLTERAELTRFARVTGPAVAVILIVTALGIVATWRLQQLLGWLAAGVAGAAALLQLVQAGRDTNFLDGNGSTFSLLLGLAIGWAVVASVTAELTRVQPKVT
jgi:hypothetical protein